MSTDTSIATSNSDTEIYHSMERFEQAQRLAELISKSTIIPDHYKNNTANCFLAIHMATRMKIDPLMFMQKSHVISGKLGIEAQVLIGALNNSGLIKGRVNFEYDGDNTEGMKCTAFATDAKTNKRVSYTLSKKVATQVKNAKINDLWNKLPALMLAYRAATYMIRLNYPEVMLGFYSKEELQDVSGEPVDVSPREKDKTLDIKTNPIDSVNPINPTSLSNIPLMVDPLMEAESEAASRNNIDLEESKESSQTIDNITSNHQST